MANSYPILGALGFFGGFFIVPVSAILQHRPAKEQKGAVLGAAGLALVGRACSWLRAFIGSLPGFHSGPRGVFLIGALMTLAATFI